MVIVHWCVLCRAAHYVGQCFCILIRSYSDPVSYPGRVHLFSRRNRTASSVTPLSHLTELFNESSSFILKSALTHYNITQSYWHYRNFIFINRPYIVVSYGTYNGRQNYPYSYFIRRQGTDNKLQRLDLLKDLGVNSSRTCPLRII